MNLALLRKGRTSRIGFVASYNHDLQARSIPGVENLEREDQSTIQEFQTAIEPLMQS